MAGARTDLAGGVQAENVVLYAGDGGLLVESVGQKDAADSVPVVAASAGYCSDWVSVTRPANTDAYTANDVVGATAAAITFPTMGPSAGGSVIITSAEFLREATALIASETSYTLYLYSVTPPSALADNAAFSLADADRASFLDKISLGTPVDEGANLYVRADGINQQIKLASGSLYGYLVTAGGYTPASAAVHRLRLHSVGV